MMIKWPWSLHVPACSLIRCMGSFAGVVPTTWASLGIDAESIHMFSQRGMMKPSPIQAAAIPKILAGESIGLQSSTGSGKVDLGIAVRQTCISTVCSMLPSRSISWSLQTLAYLLPALALARKLRKNDEMNSNNLKVLVVAPSQELAMQILKVAQVKTDQSFKCLRHALKISSIPAGGK